MPDGVSPILPSDIQDTVPDSTGSICTKLTALWSLANKMFTWFDWFLNDDGTVSDDARLFLAPATVPIGGIAMWPLSTAPDGWIVANGATVSRTTYAALFDVYGTAFGSGDGVTTFEIPDMRRMFPFGASGSNLPGSTGGAESVELTVANLAAHTHGLNEDVVSALIGNPVVAATTATSTPGATFTGLDDSDGDLLSTTGSGDPVNILNPYFSVHFIIKI